MLRRAAPLAAEHAPGPLLRLRLFPGARKSPLQILEGAGSYSDRGLAERHSGEPQPRLTVLSSPEALDVAALY